MLRVIPRATLASFLGLVLAALAWPAQRDTEQASSQDVVERAIRSLWSQDDGVRRAAKEQIVCIGHPAIQRLASLLNDIYVNPYPVRFAEGREEEGTYAWEHAEDFPVEYLCSLEISGRLKYDAAELLGQMHALEAAPILIKLMKREETVGTDAGWGLSPLGTALVQMGSAVVPLLIDDIETPTSVAWEKEAASNKATGSDDKKFYPVGLNRKPCVIVLGEIGDRRALPALNSLLRASNAGEELEFESDFLKEAISRIRRASRDNGKGSR